jgi:hypothetical protein
MIVVIVAQHRQEERIDGSADNAARAWLTLSSVSGMPCTGKRRNSVRYPMWRATSAVSDMTSPAGLPDVR